jgi:hypothetical protein
MKYADMAPPPRSEHLWRYTPWHWMHPSDIEIIPDALPIRFEAQQPVEMTTDICGASSSNEYARVFLHEVAKTSTLVSSSKDNELMDLYAVASGHVACSHLHFDIKHSVTILLHLSGEADWCGLHITSKVAKNLNVSFALVNELSNTTTYLECQDWDIAQDSSVEFAGLTLGGFRTKSDIRTNLNGKAANMTQAISTHGIGQRHSDHHIEIHHVEPHTTSSLSAHSACDDESHLVATGLLTIAKHANQSDAGQVFRNLLLSPKARAESLPELEVLADDVSAAHGAASAPVDENQMHYMMSRGFSPAEASSLIVEGFLTAAFGEIKNPSIIDAVRTRLTVHLECHIKR